MLYQMAAHVHRDLSEPESDEMSHDSASRLLSQYLKHPGYRVTNFRRRVYFECQYQLFDGGHQDRPSKAIKRKMVPLDAVTEVKAGNGNGHEDTSYSLQDILSDHPQGAQIIIDIFRSKSYREAMETVSTYVSKRWLFDHAVRLKHVYRNTRRRHAHI